MSPPPPIDPEIVPNEFRDGILAAIIGGLSMTARLLLSTDKVSWGWAARRVLAASITAVLVHSALQGYITSSGLLIGAVGAIAYASPEALDALIRWIKAKSQREVEKVEGKTDGHKKQSVLSIRQYKARKSLRQDIE